MCIDVQSRQMLWKKMKHVPLLVVPINWVFKHVLISAVMLREAGRVAGKLGPQAVMLSYANITKRSVPCFRYIVTFRSKSLRIHQDWALYLQLQLCSDCLIMNLDRQKQQKATVQTVSPDIFSRNPSCCLSRSITSNTRSRWCTVLHEVCSTGKGVESMNMCVCVCVWN